MNENNKAITTPPTFVNGVTPLNAENLNKLSTAITETKTQLDEMTAIDIGAVEQKKDLLSSSIPYISRVESETNGLIEIAESKGNDIINVKSINEFGFNDLSHSVELCTARSNSEGSSLIIETKNTFGGWYSCYVNIDIDGLKPNTSYKFKALFNMISGYAGNENIKGVTIYEKENTGNVLGQFNNINVINSNFTTSDTGNIKIRIYPKSTAHDGSTTIVCSLTDIMVYEGSNDIEFVKYYNKSFNVNGKSKLEIILLQNANISCKNGLYNNSIKIYKLKPVGVYSVNNNRADENGNVILPKTLLSGEVGVCFGDSNTEFGDKPYTEHIQDITGATIINCGFGGTRYVTHNGVGNFNLFSMCKLTDAIISNDFSQQDAVVSSMPGKYAKHLNNLKNIDWSKVKFITFNFGTNDFTSSMTQIGESNSENTEHINGALNYILPKIIQKFPHIKVYMLAPIFRKSVPNQSGNSDEFPSGASGNTMWMKDIVEAIRLKSNEYHLPFKDLYNELGINKYNADRYFESDGTHLNEFYGKYKIAEVISKFLVSN